VHRASLGICGAAPASGERVVAHCNVEALLAHRTARTQRPLVLVRGLRAADELARPHAPPFCVLVPPWPSQEVVEGGQLPYCPPRPSASVEPPHRSCIVESTAGLSLAGRPLALCRVWEVPAAAAWVPTTLDDPAPIDKATALGVPYFHVPILPTTLPRSTVEP
jgi:hypothetical protein